MVSPGEKPGPPSRTSKVGFALPGGNHRAEVFVRSHTGESREDGSPELLLR
jgi:hypothetical protein